LVNGTKTSDFGGGTITVSFPYTPKAGEDPSKLTIWFIKDDGTIEQMGGHYDAKNKCFVFETTHLSRYALVSDTRVNPFTDVTDTDYYYDAVLWAVDKGVTSGISATTFAPNATCTRAQAVTFLWRAKGSPEPSSAVNPFTDVKSDAYYYKAVLWAMEKGITSGTSAKTFSPETVCNRSQAVTFLWSSAGKPVVNYAMSFTDVPADSYFTEAVRWAVSEGITSGTGAATFSPAADCTRAQTVSFLWRYRSK
ncbi:MAG: S-layer homology domain-containing protein, partial [Oscillospiraceae bacterium]